MSAWTMTKWKERLLIAASIAVLFSVGDAALGQRRGYDPELGGNSDYVPPRPPYVPPSSNNSNTYNPTNDIMRAIIGGIDAASRNQQNTRPQPQYRPQPQQYNRPQTNTYRPQTNTVPRNIQTVRNVLPSAQSTPNVNPFADAKFATVTPEQAQQLITGANQDILTSLDADRKVDEAVVDDWTSKVPGPLTPDERKELAAAIKAGDSEKVKVLCQGLAAGSADAAIKGTECFASFNALDDAVRMGKRADELAPLIDRVKQTHVAQGGGGILLKDRIDLRYDHILRQVKQRDALYDAFTQGGPLVPTNGGLPLGQTTVLFFPNMPPGIVMVAGNVFVTGGPMEMQPITTAQVLGQPVGTSAPLAEGSSDASIGLTLVNPKKNGVPFNYTLDDRQMSLTSGQAASFTDGPEWIVMFDRGDGNGTARQKVVAGSYQFTAAGGSWDLTKQTYETTIDNSANNNAFHYVINSEPAVIEPRSSRTHTSDYPPVITFDTGTGQDRTKKVTEAKATYRVGIDSSSNTWDLFDSVAPGGLKSNLLATTNASAAPVTSLNLGAGLTNKAQQ
jgi:hypothetical protein